MTAAMNEPTKPDRPITQKRSPNWWKLLHRDPITGDQTWECRKNHIVISPDTHEKVTCTICRFWSPKPLFNAKGIILNPAPTPKPHVSRVPPRTKIIYLRCQWCGKEFSATRSDIKYCSKGTDSKCRVAAHRAARKS